MKHTLVIDSQGMVEYDLYQMERMDDQLLDILNLQLDDFDASLGQLRKKKEILSGVVTNKTENDEAYQLEVSYFLFLYTWLVFTFYQLSDLNSGFKRRMNELLQERELIQRHSDGLQILQNKFKNEKQLKTIRRNADDALRKYGLLVSVLFQKKLTIFSFIIFLYKTLDLVFSR